MIIKIIESGINLSCYINNIDWDELTSKFSHLYNPDFVNKICRKLINEIKNQYNLPDFVIPRLYDYKDEFLCELYTIATLVKNNKNVNKETSKLNNEIVNNYSLKLETEI